jgi:hypothetical protein
LEILLDAHLSPWLGAYCETLGPDTSHTQLELYCEADAEVFCFGQFSFFEKLEAVQPRLEEILRTLEINRPNDWS